MHMRAKANLGRVAREKKKRNIGVSRHGMCLRRRTSKTIVQTDGGVSCRTNQSTKKKKKKKKKTSNVGIFAIGGVFCGRGCEAQQVRLDSMI
jgi:hypothetical protein